ncbi:MAG: leucine--tRNA ligase, partial [Planctomycetota bacterium]
QDGSDQEGGEPGTQQRSRGSRRRKYYCLDMFPYPSLGGFTVNQLRGIAITDVVARYQEARGREELRPIGWDSFGLSIEEEAQARGVSPQEVVSGGIEVMRAQLKEFGARVDWDRELSTADPSFYRWTQWLFLKLMEEDLAYREEVPMKWCPRCRVNLANEEVVAGSCVHCQMPVEERKISQWQVRITRYAERLHQGLHSLKWPQRVKSLQRNWIGRRDGYQLILKVSSEFLNEYEELTVFLKRLELLPAITYLLMAPEHPLVEKVCDALYWEEVQLYREEARRKTERERRADSGVPDGCPTGAYFLNPINLKRMPIWVSTAVLPSTPFQAVLGIPGHDSWHQEFARRFRLPSRVVLAKRKAGRRRLDAHGRSRGRAREAPKQASETPREEEVMINSGSISGMTRSDAVHRIRGILDGRGILEPHISYNLRDWIFARQRFWGEPIPVVHCGDCGIVPVDAAQLPVELPDLEGWAATEEGVSPLARAEGFCATPCPRCGKEAQRETDTMPQWAASCWYYLRYLCPTEDGQLFRGEEGKKWLPVDLCVGGIEHAILHLLYVRFFSYFMHDLGLLDEEEPFRRVFNQGRISIKQPSAEIKGIATHRGDRIEAGDYLKRFGGDALRLHLLFLAPAECDVIWSESGLRGCQRFLARAREMVLYRKEHGRFVSRRVLVEKHRLIYRVTRSIRTFRFNKAVSAFMEFVKVLRSSEISAEEVDRATLKVFLTVLAPFAPHLAAELWQQLGGENTVFDQEWPAYSEELLKPLTVEIGVLINDTLCDRVTVESGLPRADLMALIRQRDRVRARVGDRPPDRTIWVRGRLVKLVYDEDPREHPEAQKSAAADAAPGESRSGETPPAAPG